MGLRHSRYFLAFTLYTLHSTPYTLHSTPYTLHSTPYTLHLTLYTAAPLPASYPLIRNSSCVISCVDDATAGELGLFDEVYHAHVILMRVNADIAALS